MIELIPTKSILTRSKGYGWFGTDYTMNLYKGCHHGCVYCDSRSLCYRIENFSKVRGKQDSLLILEKELRKKRIKGVIGTGSMSDPYNYFEKKYCFTKDALELINTRGFGISIATKSHLVVRDISILNKISKHSPVNVSLSVCTKNDALARKFERNVSLPSQRFDAIRTLSSNGIYSGIILMPILPYITDDWESIKQVVLSAKDSGASYVYPFWGMTLRDKQKDYYFSYLQKHAPHILAKYKNGNPDRYFQPIQNYQEIKDKFEQLCVEIGMEYSMGNIISNYRDRYKLEQLTLF
ncbi:MAG: SPL family radical SAM protein [Carnobacterium maltaromaticum]